MKTESGQSSAAGACWDRPSAGRQRVGIGRVPRPGQAVSTTVRLMWVTMPSASLRLGLRTSHVPITRSLRNLTGQHSTEVQGFILSSGTAGGQPGQNGSAA